MTTSAQKFRQLLQSGEFIVSPGVYDGYSIRLAEAAGFKTACTSGAAMSNALLGVPVWEAEGRPMGILERLFGGAGDDA